MKNLIILYFMVFMYACTSNHQDEVKPDAPIKPPAQDESEEIVKGKKLNLWATMYYMKVVKPTSSGVPIRDMNDRVIGPTISAQDWCLGAIEGTIMVDDTVYNYAGTKRPNQASCSHRPSSRVRWKVSPFKYGIGNRNNPLRPFKSIATDRSVIPSGSRLYIPAAVGVEYIFEGEKHVHNGIFYADDVGGAIKGNQIDVFIGAVDGGLSAALEINPFEFIKSRSSATFEAYILE